MTTWTRAIDPDIAVSLLPPWFAVRMLGARGSYGFLLTTGDVVRVSRVTAIHVSSSGSILIDVLLDHAGVPGGVDMAWQPKHFLGAPVPGANLATLNLAQVVMAIEFTAPEIAENIAVRGLAEREAFPATLSVGTDPVAPSDTESSLGQPG